MLFQTFVHHKSKIIVANNSGFVGKCQGSLTLFIRAQTVLKRKKANSEHLS